jgi:hypothetical protein
MPAAKDITQENHVNAVDKNPGLSRLVDDLSILNDFAALDIELSTSVVGIGILAAGFDEDIDEFIAYCRGMAHLPTTKIDRRGLRAVVVWGSLDQWQIATVEGCRAPAVRDCPVCSLTTEPSTLVEACSYWRRNEALLSIQTEGH